MYKNISKIMINPVSVVVVVLILHQIVLENLRTFAGLA